MKKFDIPDYYKSSIISKIKETRKTDDPRKKDFTPTVLDFGPVTFMLPRHFGFCYGVKNAIEIVYRIINENKDKRIFLLSEMIHNPDVNEDLQSQGIKFLMDTSGNKIYDWNDLTEKDIVIIPAFGTTLEIEEELKRKGINPYNYDTTCPFVEKVWNKSNQLGGNNFTVIIHGKYKHEETRATFSHTIKNAPSIIVRDIEETKVLAGFILGEISISEFTGYFKGRLSPGFDPEKDLQKIGVVNQTTMLASETEEIANLLKNTLLEKYGEEDFKLHFADTHDTLCYATNDNQQAILNLLNEDADLAIVIGGYNSSNTSHLAELLQTKFKTYFISDENKFDSKEIYFYDLNAKTEKKEIAYLPEKKKVKIIISSGASCPDSLIDSVLNKLISFFPEAKELPEVV